MRRKRPYLLVGWLWYLVMLLPVIGIVQVGDQARADRYTYLPQIGLYLLLAWAAADVCAGWRYRRMALGGCSAVILGALIVCARNQASYWRNSESLWTHTLACTSGNFTAHDDLGLALLDKGNLDAAITQFRQALKIKPEYARAHSLLGNALLQQGNVDAAMVESQTSLRLDPNDAEAQNDLADALLQKGRVDEAMVHCRVALEINPDSMEAHINLGNALLRKGALDEAISQFRQALLIRPDNVLPHYNLGNALLRKGDAVAAIVQYQRALQIKPDYAEAHNNLGSALLRVGKVSEALTHFQRALEIEPNYLDAQNNLAWLLAAAPEESLRNGERAVQLAQKANRSVGGRNPIILRTLAAADAEAGRFGDAVQNARAAMELARAAGQPELAAELAGELKLYETGRPFHEADKAVKD